MFNRIQLSCNYEPEQHSDYHHHISQSYTNQYSKQLQSLLEGSGLKIDKSPVTSPTNNTFTCPEDKQHMAFPQQNYDSFISGLNSNLINPFPNNVSNKLFKNKQQLFYWLLERSKGIDHEDDQIIEMYKNKK